MTPIQKLKEENMILRKGLNDTLEKLNQVHDESVRAIEKLNHNEREYDKFNKINNMYDVDLSYMMRTGRFAWGERGKQIAGFYVRPVIMNTLDKLKKLNESTSNSSTG
jgi:hypothetical protein